MGAEAAPPLLDPLGPLGQRVQQAQIQEALQFKGLLQQFYGASPNPYWTYAGVPTALAAAVGLANGERIVAPWMVASTLEVSELAVVTGATVTGGATTHLSIYRADPKTYLPDGPPVTEVTLASAVAATTISGSVGPVPIEPGLYWTSVAPTAFTTYQSVYQLPLLGLPIFPTSPAPFAAGAYISTALYAPAAGATPGPVANVTGDTWTIYGQAPCMAAKVRPI